MGLLDAADAVHALFGRPPGGFDGALLLASVLLAHRPKLPEVIFDDEEEPDG